MSNTDESARLADLIERMRNPMWVNSAGAFASYASPQLDIEATKADLTEAADAIARLAAARVAPEEKDLPALGKVIEALKTGHPYLGPDKVDLAAAAWLERLSAHPLPVQVVDPINVLAGRLLEDAANYLDTLYERHRIGVTQRGMDTGKLRWASDAILALEQPQADGDGK